MHRLLLVTMIVTFAGLAHAGVKPIVGMADYNGTYWGAPNTGTVCDSTLNCQQFTTLYRDNYYRTSGCAGERCGKHPGVDIAVPPNTEVHAALGGKVVVAACDWNNVRGANAVGFGGLVIIESDNPYMPGNKVYVGYAHLDKWDLFQVDVSVSEGTVIGRSGGNPTTGVCPGGSGGSHVHFQVDKFPPVKNARGVSVPWYPYGQTETADSNFEVIQKTHNPLPFVLGYAYNFTFLETGYGELWGAANVSAAGVIREKGLWADSSSPYVYLGRSSLFAESTCSYSDGKPCSKEITLDADIFKNIAIRLNFKCVANPVVIWWRGPDDIWHAGSFNYDAPRMYVLNASGVSSWKGIITDFLVQPSQGCTASPGPEEYFVRDLVFIKK